MGVWGTGIYSNDTAEDVREACQDIFAFYEVEEGNQKLFKCFKELLDSECIDDDYASFWYALADWQWKHGMLTEYVKEKTMSLLDAHAGLEQWVEAGNKADKNNRLKVLDGLKQQLQTEQRPFRKPKLRCVRPKHKPGDIVIFKATDFVDEYDSTWHIKRFRPPFVFDSDYISKSKYEDVDGCDAHGKYMAILCVGSVKETHSEYVPEVFDEFSLYVWYNYLSEDMPSVAQLEKCGFLPFFIWTLKEYNPVVTKAVFWEYRFSLGYERFRSDKYIDIIKVLKSTHESERFYGLYKMKDYGGSYYSDYGLNSMFYTAFEEKVRMELIDLRIDDLLNPDVYNPTLLSPEKVDQANREWRKTNFPGLI